MLEGLPNWIGAGDREDFVLEANDCERNPGSYRCGELYWAITEVKDAKVALLGAEPMPEEEMQFIFEQSNGAIGFEDFIGYEISRMIIQAKRQDGFRVQDVPGIVAGQLEYLQWTLSGLEPVRRHQLQEVAGRRGGTQLRGTGQRLIYTEHRRRKQPCFNRCPITQCWAAITLHWNESANC